jgi:hypothetical protein
MICSYTWDAPRASAANGIEASSPRRNLGDHRRPEDRRVRVLTDDAAGGYPAGGPDDFAGAAAKGR